MPVRVFLELLLAAIHRTATILPLQKHAREAPRDFLGNLIEVHLPAGAGREFHRELIAIVGVLLNQRPDDQCVNGHAVDAAPVRVAPKHPGVGFAREVRDAALHAVVIGLDQVLISV